MLALDPRPRWCAAIHGPIWTLSQGLPFEKAKECFIYLLAYEITAVQEDASNSYCCSPVT